MRSGAEPTNVSRVRANGIEFGLLEAGTGPLALCLHGFPDSPYTWRHLMPSLAEAGFHAVAPFMRGYAPTELPPDRCFSRAALASDAIALHEALGADERAVLVGHDWGAAASYSAGAFAPDRWRRLVTMAIPPPGLDGVLLRDYDQLKRFFYVFMFQIEAAEQMVAADDLAILERFWADWSPGYDATADLRHVRDCLRDPAYLSAALDYYRTLIRGGDDRCDAYAELERSLGAAAPQPTLYLHGENDGCVGVDLVRESEPHLAEGSSVRIVESAGHFLHLERPAEINARIVGWLTG